MKAHYLLFVLPLSFFACKPPKTGVEKRIRVSGEGKVRVMPDQVCLSIQVSFTQPKMAQSVAMTQQTVDSVMQILSAYGKEGSDIKTSSVSANKAYNYDSGREVFVGYQASQGIDFVLNDISKFTELSGKLLQTKISSINNIQFAHSKADSLYREADLLAYDDAEKSAKKLCDRAHVQLGKLLFLSNTGGSSSVPYEILADEAIGTFNKGNLGRGFRISPEVLEFSRSIVSEFEIED